MNLPSNNSDDPEGVIKFELDFVHASADLGFAGELAEIEAWRTVLWRLGLTGQDAARYGGLAYGNVSRIASWPQFLISGTQTGGKARLGVDDFCLVLTCDVRSNSIKAQGPVQPSSEALTHGAIYDAAPRTGCVIHVHSPEIWRNAKRLGIYMTEESVAYGTPEMGWSVGRAAALMGKGVMAMGGHEDGVLAFDDTVEAAALTLLRCLALALRQV